MTFADALHTSTRKFQVGTAVLALATAAAVTPVVAPVVSHAAPLVTAAPVLTWGFDQLDAALIAADNDNGSAASTSAVPGANVVGATPTPVELLQYLVQGIARGVELVVGTPVYVAIAFTGLVITTVGGFLPGPIGDFVVGVGTTVNNVANSVAAALRVGPYGTSTA